MKILLLLSFSFVFTTINAQPNFRYLTLADAEQAIIFSKPHYLTNEWSGKVIDVEDGALAGDQKGKKVQLYEKHGPVVLGSDGLNQLWYIIPSGLVNGKQTFKFLNAGYMNFLHARNGTGFAENLKGAETNEQHWYLAKDDHNQGAGFYIISAGEMNGTPIANYHHSKDNNANVGLLQFDINVANHTRADYNFIISDYEVSPATHPSYASPAKLYNLLPLHAKNKCLDLKNGGEGNNNAVQIWDGDINNRNEQWFLALHPIRGANSAFSIRAANSTSMNWKRYVVPYDNGKTNGTPLVVFNSSDQAQPQQLWLMLPVLREPGVYVNFAYNNSGKCMDVTGMVTSNATTVQLWNFENNANQKWSIRTIR